MSSAHELVVCTRSRMFSAAHFYKQDKFTDEENRRVFGACYSPHGHGHNYRLEISLEGPLEPGTLTLIAPGEFDRLIDSLAGILDHRHLNFDIPEFRDVVPTIENIALYLRAKALAELERLRAAGSVAEGVGLRRLRLFETPDLWAEVEG